MTRKPHIHHSTSEPCHFVGRQQEIATLDQTLIDTQQSLVAMIGPGGQGKTAITQHWLHRLDQRQEPLDGLFLWSFYRGKESDVFLRELLAYADDLPSLPDVSASYCVDFLLPLLQRERWVLILDGTEVVQHQEGPWFGRFLHPELARLLEELAAAPMPGVVVVTTRFPLPTLTERRHAQILPLSVLDVESAVSLLRSFGVDGKDNELQEAALSCGLHAKAVELLATLLVHFHGGNASAHRQLPSIRSDDDASTEEKHVLRVLDAYRDALSPEQQDIVALATAFRQPPTESQLLRFLASKSVQAMLDTAWHRHYLPFDDRLHR